MDNNKEHNEERFTRNVMETSGVQQPSAGFTESLMARLRERVQNPLFAYRPVFTKKHWIAIASIFTAIIVLAIVFPGGSDDTPFGQAFDYINQFMAFFGESNGAVATWGVWFLGFALIPALYLIDKMLRKKFRSSEVSNRD